MGLPMCIEPEKCHNNRQFFSSVTAPAVFEIAMRLLRPILSQQVREATVTFGTNKDEWQRYLRSIIDKDQLLKDYGGNIEHDI